jgi:hypothetical protein
MEYQRVHILHHVSEYQLAFHIAVPGFDTSCSTLENGISGKHRQVPIYPHIPCIANNPKASPIPLPMGGASGKRRGAWWCAYASTKNWRRALVTRGEVVASASVRAYCHVLCIVSDEWTYLRWRTRSQKAKKGRRMSFGWQVEGTSRTGVRSSFH